MKNFLKLSGMLAFSMLACAPQTNLNDVDAIRREIIVKDVNDYTGVLHKSEFTFCLASSEDFALPDGERDFHIYHVVPQDNQPDFIKRIQREDYNYNGVISFVPISHCDGWVDSQARRQGAILILINNIRLQDKDHATAESDSMFGKGGAHIKYKLERQSSGWKIVSSSVTVEA